jgi:uncharacterized membrane protein
MVMPTRLVAAATAAYAAIFAVLGVDRYVTFHSGADLGLFTQTIASAFRGFSNTIEGTSHFAYHFSPILYLCAPLLWLTHSAVALIVLQAVVTALIAPALYAIARKRTCDVGAATLASIALLYPPLQGVTFTDFHETAFMPATIAWLLWAIDARRFGVAGLLVLVALSIKEDQALTMAFVGLVAGVYFARRRERRGVIFGAGVIVASVLVFWGYFAIVRPLAGATRAWVPGHFYAWNGWTSTRSLAVEIGGRLTYLLEAFVPLALVPLRSPVVLLAAPGLLEVLSSREPLMYTMGQHYAAVWVPYVLVAFVVAGARLISTNAVAGRRWVAASIVLSTLMLAFFNPLHLAHFLRVPNAADAATNAAIAKIPQSASVGTYDEIYAHLGFFPQAATNLRSRPQYVVFDDRYRSTTWTRLTFPKIQSGLASGTYRVVAVEDGVTLLERQ